MSGFRAITSRGQVTNIRTELGTTQSRCSALERPHDEHRAQAQHKGSVSCRDKERMIPSMTCEEVGRCTLQVDSNASKRLKSRTIEESNITEPRCFDRLMHKYRTIRCDPMSLCTLVNPPQPRNIRVHHSPQVRYPRISVDIHASSVADDPGIDILPGIYPVRRRQRWRHWKSFRPFAVHFLHLYILRAICETMGDETLLSVEEISKHSSAEDCWIVVEGKVWDLTEFAPSHPGGAHSKYP